MANVELHLTGGNNLISFPVDMTGVSYQQDPSIIFAPQLMNFNNLEEGEAPTLYMFNSVFTLGQAIFNVDGVWNGNLTEIEPQFGYWIHASTDCSVFLNGDLFTSPETFEYKINSGNNLFSYLPTVNRPFGTGSYAVGDTPDVSFGINPNLLKGSGHADACITSIFTTGLLRGYTGEGSDSSSWTGNLTEFEVGKAYYITTDLPSGSSFTANLWTEISNTDNYVAISGVTTADTDGNRAFYWFSGGITAYNSWVQFIPFYPFVIRDSSGTDIYVASSNNGATGTCTTLCQLAFVNYDKLYTDPDRPLFHIAGGVGCIDPSNLIDGQDTIGVGNYPRTLIDETLCGTISDTALVDADSQLLVSANTPEMCGFANLSNMYFVSWFMMATTMNVTGLGGGGQLMDDKFRVQGFHSAESYYTNMCGSGDRVCPIIYNPSAIDGERFRFTKYYPHPQDLHIGSSGGFYYIEQPEYFDIFFNEDGTRKYDEVLGEPYAPAIEKIFPYRYNVAGEQYGDIKNWCMYGILQML